MKTKIPFAGRTLFLACIVVGISCTVVAKLVDLQIVDTANEIAALRELTAEAMLSGIGLARTIAEAENILADETQRMYDAEQAFTQALGSMLQDGHFTDDTYAPGQEAALLADAEETLRRLSRPQYSYTISEADLSDVPGYEDEVFKINTAAHIICEAANINAYGYADKVTDRKDKPGQRRVTIATDEAGTGSSKMTAFMDRIADMAQLLKDERAIYQRAEALSPSGTTSTGKLEGLGMMLVGIILLLTALFVYNALYKK